MTIEAAEHDLIVLPIVDAFAVFSVARINGSPHPIDPILAHVRAEIDAFRGDASTADGRSAIKSIAARVAKAKVALEKEGKLLADQQKAIPKLIDATRKHIVDTLDAWRDEVRAPATEWEATEQARLDKHRATLAMMDTAGMMQEPIDALRSALADVSLITVGPECQEFRDEYGMAKGSAIRRLNQMIADTEQREAEAIELSKLRKEADVRAAADRDEQLRREGAAEAVNVAMQAAAHREAVAAAAAATLALEQSRREADATHRRKINTAAVAAFETHGVAVDIGKSVIRLIASGLITGVTMRY